MAQESLVAEVKAELVARGVSVSGPCGAFEITKRVAWRKRHEGWGLHGGKSPAQNGCTVGEERYSHDWILKANGDGVDILRDAGDANNPAWDEKEGDPSFYREPIDPGDGVIIITPVPQPDNGMEYRLSERLDQLEVKLDAVITNQLIIQNEARLHHESTETFQQKVGDEWRWLKNTARAILRYGPFIAAGVGVRELMGRE